MNTAKNMVTVLVISETGIGKSQLGNAFLQKDLFEVSSRPDSCTFKTSAHSNVIDGITRNFIDTQGLQSSDGKNAPYIQQMIQFLKEWKHGVNAFFILLNVTLPRFDERIQLLITIINDFFNNPDFWNHTGIIFTNCYKGRFDRNVKQNEYRQKVIDYIKKLQGCSRINPQMPCFFVDSPYWKEDVDTQRELIRIFEFAHKMNPVPTQQLNVVRPDFKSRELITENRVLVSSKLVGSGASQVRINNYEDRVYYKQTDWKNNVTYSAKEVKRAYNETKRSTVNVEKKVFVDGTHDTPIFRTEKYGGRRYGIAGPRRTRQVFDHTDRKTSYSERERDIITNPDGVVSYGEWRTIRSWNDVTRV